MFPRTAASAVIALAAAMSLTLGGAPALAGPFTTMAGEWSGGGQVTLSSGSERLRCRASNSSGQGGDVLNLSIKCASDSYKIDLSGYIRNNNGAVSGEWSETNYNSAGSLQGRVSGGRVNALAVGNTFSARLSMSSASNRLSVTIHPEATDVKQVSLSFQKR